MRGGVADDDVLASGHIPVAEALREGDRCAGPQSVASVIGEGRCRQGRAVRHNDINIF